MSYCELVHFVDGKADYREQFTNSHGGATRIWHSLGEAYLGSGSSWILRPRPLWDLANRKDLADFVRTVHMFTFDRALVFRKDFGKFAEHLRLFDREFPREARYVNHLPAWRTAFLEAGGEEKVQAIGLYGTSCGDDLWEEWVSGDDEDEDEEGEDVPYDLSHNKHFDVYQVLADGGA